MADFETPAPIGHNRPPADPLTEALAERFKPLLDEAEKLALQAQGIQSIADETGLAAAAQIVADITALVKRADRTRESEKEPHLAAGRKIDRFFNDRFDGLLDPFKAGLKNLQRTYLNAKAERERRAREDEAKRQREIAD